MTRELLISSYLLFIRFWFVIFSIKPLKNKTVLIASFGDNIDHVRKSCLTHTEHDLIILTTNSSRISFEESPREKVLRFETIHIVEFIKSIYHVATSKVIFVDNYFGFLAAATFKPEVKVVQLWHAAGAIKRFGLEDPTIKKRSRRANKRFKQVYQRFTHVVVGSEKMTTIFKQAFDLKEKQILRTGIPRTDFFFNDKDMRASKKSVINKYSSIKNKKVILYAPTFRDSEIADFQLQIDVSALKKAFGSSHKLLLRLHPVVRSKKNYNNDDFIIDVSDYPNINELLLVTDYLISDYSSIPFEFSLLNRPMLFFSYDLDSYLRERGVWEDYHTLVPGPVFSSTEKIISIIEANKFNHEKLAYFKEDWNTYSKGTSSSDLVNYIYN
ncbi:CDP-glycerol glycerophosphotransferase (TagB/SpsB family) [Streptohalobacillus salinus]|uniref:CDP-glycerol glycerophosphotransferase (TagB/SpsB family) n=1 Tax=Streptohalobacillus salinus TaxID=621096 RepID=A0A2V3WCJ7_9BACI|nr:CDP-glycerol glycerophosphotransferase family protein [Streptohalobacillus salinus]PXW92032.1 CDP-glycerol glycerophosphotransferase (TagB/SpsB family) [Streptohalobacillus salinus]